MSDSCYISTVFEKKTIAAFYFKLSVLHTNVAKPAMLAVM